MCVNGATTAITTLANQVTAKTLTMHEAITREKQLKRWHRQWKINLVESENPHWVDLAPSLGLPPLPSC